MLRDYVDNVGELVRENDLIETRVGRYDQLNLIEWLKPEVRWPKERDYDKEQKQETDDIVTVYLTSETKTSVYNCKDKFDKFRKYRDEYDQRN